ncbi:MAG: biotin/lipoyl-containing protein [Acidobacteriaceae bacterium]
MILEIEFGGEKHRVEITRRESKFLLCMDGGDAEETEAFFPEAGVIHFLREGRSYEFRVENAGLEGELTLDLRGSKIAVSVRDPRSLRARRSAADDEAGPKKIIAPMPGKVVRILATAGTAVEAGEGVIVIEAMKMQNELKSPKSGIVRKIAVSEGATVNPGDTLAVVE